MYDLLISICFFLQWTRGIQLLPWKDRLIAKMSDDLTMRQSTSSIRTCLQPGEAPYFRIVGWFNGPDSHART